MCVADFVCLFVCLCFVFSFSLFCLCFLFYFFLGGGGGSFVIFVTVQSVGNVRKTRYVFRACDVIP